jgi:hypothetical protein
MQTKEPFKYLKGSFLFLNINVLNCWELEVEEGSYKDPKEQLPTFSS